MKRRFWWCTSFRGGARKQRGIKPWLWQALMQQGPKGRARFSSYYTYLRALPRSTRRALQGRLAQSLAGVALLLALGQAPAWAATIAVDDTPPVISSDGECSLVEAIINANDDATTHADCAEGSGPDILELPQNVIHTLTAFYDSTYGPTGLPLLISDITIQGDTSTITRDPTAPAFRILAVNSEGTLTVQDTTISGGVIAADDPHDDGGGIANYGGSVTLTNSTVSGNSSISDGGGMYNFGPLTLTNSTVSGNSAAEDGGGVFNLLSTVTLSNSTVSGNTAGSLGGGMGNFSSTVTLTRTLIAGNTAGGAGDEVLNGGSTVTANDFNLFGHSGVSQGDAFANFVPGATDINATMAGTCTAGVCTPTALSAILAPLALNPPGNTATHALPSGSPAIDASPDDGGCEATDQRGVLRPQGAACDIGAFEVEVVVGTDPCDGAVPTNNCQISGQPGLQPCVGGGGNDIITGTSGNDVIIGADGNDVLRGLGGDDLLCGGEGNDRLIDSGGVNTLVGGPGDDRLEGGTGMDTILGNAGEDRILGNGGEDELSGGADNDTIDGGQGADLLEGNEGDDRLVGGAGNDSIDGGDGVDSVSGDTGVDMCSGETETGCEL